MKQIIQMEHNEVTNPNWKEANQLAIGQARTNKKSGQGGTWTQGFRITSPLLYPLGHAASTVKSESILTLIIPTKVVFIIKIPSVNTEIEWVSFAIWMKNIKQVRGQHAHLFWHKMSTYNLAEAGIINKK